MVALLGLRGAGKTTIGKQLARRLRVRFVELDRRIEKAADMSLAELFSLYGEDYYRRLERETLAAVLAEKRPMVLATGGGIVASPDTYALLKKSAVTVWLRAEPEDHWNRVVRQGDRRPMADHPQAMADLRALLAAREPLYAAAAAYGRHVRPHRRDDRRRPRAVYVAYPRPWYKSDHELCRDHFLLALVPRRGAGARARRHLRSGASRPSKRSSAIVRATRSRRPTRSGAISRRWRKPRRTARGW